MNVFLINELCKQSLYQTICQFRLIIINFFEIGNLRQMCLLPNYGIIVTSCFFCLSVCVYMRSNECAFLCISTAMHVCLCVHVQVCVCMCEYVHVVMPIQVTISMINSPKVYSCTTWAFLPFAFRRIVRKMVRYCDDQ